MSSDDSDLVIHSTLNKKKKKMQRTEELREEKKLSTKDMIQQALEQSQSRKGTSLQAIKKYIKENFNTDTEKINYLIKKTLKTGVETGTYVQTKGTGASGSFKLAPKIKEAKKEAKAKTEKVEGKARTEKGEGKAKPAKSKKEIENSNIEKKKSKKVLIEEAAKKLMKKKEDPPKKSKVKIKEVNPEPGTSKMTPKKRKNMMKRKSIGSIIKKPKMKPKANG